MERDGDGCASMRGRLALTLSTLKRQTGVPRLCIRADPFRHCERSEAIHLAAQRKNGLLRSARNDGKSRHTFAFSRRDAPEALLELSAQRGRGERRMPVAPAASCALVVVERTRVTTSTPESPDVPARNGFNGFLRALPGDRACLPPSPTDMFLSKPGWADLNSANLTPASRRQDHTTSPYAATSLVRSLLIAHKSFNSPCNHVARKTLPRPPHPIPRP